jgi:glucokinase
MTAIVVDIGGTTLRTGVFADGTLGEVRRAPVAGFATQAALAPEALYAALVDQLCAALSPLLARYPGAPVGIAFPGPIDARGRVVSAPTLWGDRLHDRAFGEDVAARIGRPVTMLNDVTAAVWRYADPGGEGFCLVTVSSGIGNKVFHDGAVLLGRQGEGGEIGHLVVAAGEDALPCDCGGHGHLGGLASGRGTLALARACAARLPDLLNRSPLAARPPGDWTTHDLVAAIHAGDAFARAVLTRGQAYLVTAMRTLYHFIGTRRFVFIGGFATAIGAAYIDNLGRLLAAEPPWFGLDAEAMAMLATLGEPDDDHSLIGMGRYLANAGAGA